MVIDLLGPLFIGFVGSLHCLGMCGPLVVAYSLNLRPPGGGVTTLPWSGSLTHHLAFHLGRTFTYSLMGALAAGFAHVLGLNVFSHFRGSVSLGGGIVMVSFGLLLLKVIPFRLAFPLGIPSWGGLFPPLFQSQGLPSKFLLGLTAGFLPCMVSWAMVVKAATTQDPLTGVLAMALFGLGTIPVLLFTGLSASLLSLRIRILGERVAAISVIAMGIILLFKGAGYFT